MKGDEDDTKLDIAEKEGALADLAPLQPMKPHTPVTIISAAELQNKYADKSKTVATKPSGKPWFVLADGTDLNDLPESKAKLEVNDNDDDDELFAFDENNSRPQKCQSQNPTPNPNPPPQTPQKNPPRVSANTPPLPPAASSSPAPQARLPLNSNSPNSRATLNVPSLLLPPLQTPIVSEAIHAQAASLGHVQSFVGSVKDGLDEDALQSFRLVASGGVGSLRGGAPRSLSEKMAFDDAMEAQREAERKR